MATAPVCHFNALEPPVKANSIGYDALSNRRFVLALVLVQNHAKQIGL